MSSWWTPPFTWLVVLVVGSLAAQGHIYLHPTLYFQFPLLEYTGSLTPPPILFLSWSTQVRSISLSPYILPALLGPTCHSFFPSCLCIFCLLFFSLQTPFPTGSHLLIDPSEHSLSSLTPGSSYFLTKHIPNCILRYN